MSLHPRAVAVGALLLLASCQSDQEFLNGQQATAISAATERAQFEMNCTTTEPSVLSRDIIRPPVIGPRFIGVDRTEYTIGIAGCGQRSTHVVVCEAGESSCFAGDSTR